MNKLLLFALSILVLGGVTVGSVAAAKAYKEVVPGWGYGDKNHVHTGPPGQSVRPH